MKTKILFSALILAGFLSLSTMAEPGDAKPQASVTVAATPDLYDLATTWVVEYQKLHPGEVVNVVRYTKENKPEILNAGTGLCFITDEFYTSLAGENIWKMVVGRDAIVPVISSKNPLLAEIKRKGITREQLAQIMSDPGNRQWESFAGNGQQPSVQVYMLNEGSLREGVAKFLDTDAETLNATQVSGGTELISMIAKDPYALGFCRLADLIDMNKHVLVDGISLLPIDKNSNGKLENFENIYGSLDDFLRGVWLGKYPGALTRNIYAAAPLQPENEKLTDFLKWVLDGGQQYLNPSGYFDLGYNERAAKSALLDNNIAMAAAPEASSPLQTIMIVILALIVTGSLTAWVIGSRRNKKSLPGKSFRRASRLDPGSLNAPGGLWFDKSHTWAFMEQNGMVRIGIDDFLQHIAGPLSRVKMKSPGEKVTKGEKILTIIQNGKQLDICSPVSGTIRSQNGMLNSHASMLNTAPYTDGWVYTIEPTNWLRETQFMLMAGKYTEWLGQEFIRLRDFFATSVMARNGEYIPVVLQDGGELHDNLLASFGPEVWEEFQEKFMDKG